MIPLQEVLFGESTPRISKDLLEALSKIGDWLIEENFSFIRIFGSEVGPNVLPRYISNRLISEKWPIKQHHSMVKLGYCCIECKRNYCLIFLLKLVKWY